MKGQALTTKDQVLSVLVDQAGQYVSGDELAQELGVSRESVWKAVKSLKNEHHMIASKKKRGYAYLYSEQIDELLLKRWLQYFGLSSEKVMNLHVFDDIGSTQTYAKDYLAKNPSNQPQLFIAHGQSAGYGRQGRELFAPKNRGLYISVALPVNASKKLVPSLLTTSAAVSIAQGLEYFFPNEKFMLKWVNDIILRNHKVGGVITEGVYDFESQQYSSVILGFFVNLWPSSFPSNLSNKAQSVSLEEPNGLDINAIAAKILMNLLEMYSHYQEGEYLPFYRERSLLIGHAITVKVGSEIKTGTVLAISDQGGLVFKNSETYQNETLYAGEVTKVKLIENLNL